MGNVWNSFCVAFVLYDPTTNYNPDTEVSFNLEEITCNVYTEDGRVTNLGNVLDYGWFEVSNVGSYNTKATQIGGGFGGPGRWHYSLIPVPTNGIVCRVDWEMYETLFDLGLMRERRPKGGSGVQFLEWNIVANSGIYTIKVGDELRWRINGEFKNAKSGYKQGFFFPLDYPNQYTSVNIEGVGAYDHLLDTANTASAPFWVFTGSSGSPTTQLVKDQQFLVMSSSNMNEAYGTGFKQADLEYFPAPSPYFPGEIEPVTTKFDTIKNPLEIKIGDEIRFGNNENITSDRDWETF